MSKTDQNSVFMSLDDLRFAENSRFPIWVFNIDKARVVWANDTALLLWQAKTMPELEARNLRSDMSPSVQARLQQFQTDFWKGVVFDEIWTIYPHDKAKTLACRFRGLLMPDGTMAMLCEGEDITDNSPNLIKAAQALIYTDVLVTSYRMNGSCQYANPAARRVFPSSAPDLSQRILSGPLYEMIQDGVENIAEGTTLAKVVTVFGIRLHRIEVKSSFDAISGEKSWLLTESDVSMAEEVKDELQYLANHDSLTGLKNRNFLKKHAPEFLQSATDDHTYVSMSLVDLDRFKYVNDTLGHDAGDQLLAEFARRLQKIAPKGSIVARLGGDEFCLLIRNDVLPKNICEMFLDQVNKPFSINRHNLQMNASLGFSQTSAETQSYDVLFQQADLALYAAKREGNNTCKAFNPEMSEESQRFHFVDDKIKKCLETNSLEVNFCPQFCFETEKIIGAETSYWVRLPNGKNLPTYELNSVAEATGANLQIEKWVLQKAMDVALDFAKVGRHQSISVKVSELLLQDDHFIPLLQQYLDNSKFTPKSMKLEITEMLLLTNDLRLQNTITKITQMGYQLVIRDFGTAYSYISCLQNYPISHLKLDQSLVTDGKLKILALTIISMAKALGIHVTADGVENQPQKKWLESAGCDEYQNSKEQHRMSFKEFHEKLK